MQLFMRGRVVLPLGDGLYFQPLVAGVVTKHPSLTPAQPSVAYHLPLVAFSLWFSLVPVKEGLSDEIGLASALLCTACGISSSMAVLTAPRVWPLMAVG